MELRQIYYVLEVAKYNNFSKAANALYITQPAISQQIKALEQEMQITIFKRDSHGVTLTADGERFVKHANEIVDCVDNLMSAFDMNTSSSKAIIRIGVFPFYRNTRFKRVLSAYFTQNANVLGNIRTIENYEGYKLLKDNEVDFALVKVRPENIEDWFSYDVLETERLTVIMNKSNKHAKDETIDIHKLGDFPLLTGDTNSHHYVESKEMYHKYGIDFNVAFLNTLDTDLMIDMIEEGRGIILATETVGQELMRKYDSIVSVPIEPAQVFATVLMYPKNANLRGKKLAFRNYIVDAFSSHTEDN